LDGVPGRLASVRSALEERDLGIGRCPSRLGSSPITAGLDAAASSCRSVCDVARFLRVLGRASLALSSEVLSSDARGIPIAPDPIPKPIPAIAPTEERDL
jgi:hypothetical protein